MNQFPDSLLVVIVLYREPLERSTAFVSLRTALDDSKFQPGVFIYDNSPEPSVPPERNSLTYIHNPANPGTSAAYNNAAMHAGRAGKEWLLFLDQDATVTLEFFTALERAVREYPESAVFVPKMKDRRGLVSPFRFTGGKGRRLRTVGEMLPLASHRFINNGLTIRRTTFEQAGGYDESIPLDFSDISFGGRLRSVIDHFMVIDVALQHRFSDDEGIPADAALMRFQYFCKGATVMGRKSGHRYMYLMRILFRACRLSLRYRDLRFLIHAFEQVTYG